MPDHVEPLRVVIADDHGVVRTGLRGMLAGEPDIEVVGEAATGDEAVTVVSRLRPAVILMDLRMPSGDGVSAIERLGPGHRVIVLTTYEQDADIVRAMNAGAAGYLLKDLSRAELARAIRASARGETVMSPSVVRRLETLRRAPDPPVLSAREREVLRMVARGHTNAEIGRALFIGEATVKTHLLRVYGKLDVSDRTSAVLTAMTLGLL